MATAAAYTSVAVGAPTRLHCTHHLMIIRMDTTMALQAFLPEALCLLEKCLPVIYIMLSLMAVASLAIPFLNELSLHGKSRSLTTFASDAPSINTSSWHHQILYGEAFLVPKRLFLHFYVVGILSTIVYYMYITSLDDETKQSGVAVSLLLIHLARRCRECLFVHEWRPSSKMHIAGFLLGVGHYILLPLVFVDSKRVCNTNKSDKSTSSSKTDWMIAAIGILTCLAAQYQQYRHHVYLAELRHVTYNGVIEITEYKIPSKGWFQYVSCPHYLAEILIYISFVIVLSSNSTVRIQSNYKCSSLVLWVATNLSVSAIKSHDVYVLHYPEYASFKRKAIIPFLF